MSVENSWYSQANESLIGNFLITGSSGMFYCIVKSVGHERGSSFSRWNRLLSETRNVERLKVSFDGYLSERKVHAAEGIFSFLKLCIQIFDHNERIENGY